MARAVAAVAAAAAAVAIPLARILGPLVIRRAVRPGVAVLPGRPACPPPARDDGHRPGRAQGKVGPTSPARPTPRPSDRGRCAAPWRMTATTHVWPPRLSPCRSAT